MTKITTLGLGGGPATAQTFADKTPANYPAVGLLVEEFDIWQESYDGAQVSVYYAGTTTLMPVYSDPEMTQAIANPLVLIAKEDQDGIRYGKFPQSVYSPFAYYLDIDTTQQTGVRQVPLTTIAGEDATLAYASAKGSRVKRSLEEHFGDVIHLKNYGPITDSPVTNTTTINNAIAQAASRGGGFIMCPAGVINVNSINLPSYVFLVGQGKNVTFIQSKLGGKVIQASSYSGLMNLTVDGVTLTPGSVGLSGKNIDYFFMEAVCLKRFDTIVQWQGGKGHHYHNTDMINGRINFAATGDNDVVGGSGGDEFEGLLWEGGEVSESIGTALQLSVVDRAVLNLSFANVRIHDNIGSDGALNINGAQRLIFHNCIFDGNIINLVVKDNLDAAIAENDRTVSGVHFYGGRFNGGTNKFQGKCDDLEINNMLLKDVTFNLATPTNAIVLRDCREDAVTVTGEASKLLRIDSRSIGSARVNTSAGGATTIYRQRLAPNRIALISVSAIAEQVNGTDFAVWQISHAARGAVATLAYDNQTANYTAGKNIKGQTSNATAQIVADSDSGTTGTLSLCNVVGTFLDNEIIAETDGAGSAQANGVLVEGSAALIGTATTVHSAGSNTGAPPAAWAVAVAVTGQEVLVTVDGDTGDTIQWDVKVDITYRS